MPAITGSAFVRDPEIKAESLWTGEVLSPRTVFATRHGPLVKVRDERGAWRVLTDDLAPFDTMLTHGAAPHEAAELLWLRDQLRRWRFYDQFRTDRDAPARRPQVGTRTPILADDGGDVAAAVQTISEIGDERALDAIIADAFPGSRLAVTMADGLFTLAMHQPGLLRPLTAPELSDGTLRYVLLAVALLSPRPPPVLILNEPEASLHPSLLGPLARLIVQATRRAQVIVVTHAAALVEALAAEGCGHIALDKSAGETVAPATERPAWTWPTR